MNTMPRMKRFYCITIVTLCSLILVCDALVDTGCQGSVTSSNKCVLEQSAGHVLKTVDQDNHVLKAVDQDNYVLKTVDQDNHVLKAGSQDNHVLKTVDPDNHVLKTVDPDNHVLKSVDQDNHVLKTVDQDNYVLKTVDQDNHVLTSPRGPISRFITDSLEVFAPVSTTVGNDLCRNHSLWFQNGVINNKMWALKMLDASSKLPSGLLTGNVVDLGNYDECLSVEDVQSEFGTFSGQHCTVTFGQITFVNEIDFLVKRLMEPVVHEFTEDDLTAEGVQGLLSKLSMLWSVCVPSSCGPSDVAQHLRSALRTRLGNVSITVPAGSCSTRANREPFRTIDWFVIVFFLCLVLLVLLSSIYDLSTRESSSRRDLLLAFSFPFHWSRLVRVDLPSVDALPVLNGVKVISMIIVIVSHLATITSLNPIINITTLLNKTETGLKETILSNTSLSVDPFLLISGLLLCFNFLKDREKGVEFSLPRFYWHRYIRITPLYALLQLLIVTLYTADGVFEGPLWAPNAKPIRNMCENWVHMQLFVNNFLPLEKMCLGYTWYLSVDMQLFLISPLILYPLWRQPQFGKCLLCILACVGTAISVGVAYVHKLKPNMVFDYGELGPQHYYPTYTRFTPWIIGIGLGYALHATKRVSTRLARSTVTLGWTLGVTLMMASFFLMVHFLQPGYQYDRLTASLYLGLMRPAWALGLAWVLFAMSRGYGATSMVNFLSNSTFLVLSRLSYSVYLIHVPVMVALLAVVKTAVHFSALTFVSQFCFDFLASLLCGLVCHLIVEAPSIYIERIMFAKAKKGHKEQ